MNNYLLKILSSSFDSFHKENYCNDGRRRNALLTKFSAGRMKNYVQVCSMGPLCR